MQKTKRIEILASERVDVSRARADRFRSTFRRIAALGLVLSGAALAIPSCSLIIDHSAVQCTATSDCSEIAGTVCTSGLCVDANECTTNKDCSKTTGDANVCRQLEFRKCVNLESDGCKAYGPFSDDNAVIFGVIADFGSDTGVSILNGAILGYEDINQVGLTAQSGLPPRPVALVACTDNSDNDTGEAAATHMIKDLGITAICGAAYSGITIAIAEDVSIPDGALLMSSSATSTLITGLKDQDPTCVKKCGSNTTCQNDCVGLVWRTSPSDTYQASAIAAFFKASYESDVRADIGATMDPPTASYAPNLKVAIVFKGDSYGTGLEQALEPLLVFNKMTADQNSALNPPTFQTFNYGDPDDPAVKAVNYNGAVTGLIAFQPDIILAFGTDEIVHETDPQNPTGAGIFDRVEAGWTSGVRKPHWVFSDGGLILPLSASAQAADALSRIRGTVPGTNNTNFLSFVNEYNSQFAGATLGNAQSFGAAGAYDIMFLFGYSVVAAKNLPLTGAQIATGFSRMVAKTPVINVGEKDLEDGLEIMASNTGTMNINGASGPLDFNLATGEAPSDIQIWCLPSPDGQGMVASGFPSGVAYSGIDGTITGSISSSCATVN